MAYANIIVDISIEKLDYPFTYEIPPSLCKQIKVGDQVMVPFGKGGRLRRGFVIELVDQISVPEHVIIKSIDSIAASNGVTGQLIQLAAYMKEHYGGTMNQAMKTVLPMKKEVKAKEVKSVRLKITNAQAEAVRKEYVQKHAVAKVRLLDELCKDQEIELRVITAKLHISHTTLKAMERDGMIEVIAHRQFRNPIRGQDANTYRPVLNPQQKEIVDDILCKYEAGDQTTCLIHGVTGSGKTEVYMELIDRVVSDGKQVIFLIPEISLTYQTVMRFYRRFGQRVSILHSKLSEGERFDQLERARNKEVDIMIGPRSALFTPFDNLGLIIMDEEHENSYKSEGIPRYQTREVAKERARLSGGFLVLGSATPSMDSFYQCKIGNYHYYRLAKRYNDRPLPEVSVVDLREELRHGNRSMFSRLLTDKIKGRLEKKQQVMLFLNRRGMAGFISCRSCGMVVKCPHCDVSLTQHRDGRLRCHYCGYEQPMVSSCSGCGSKHVGGFKVGTQKVEDRLKEIFPSARILRMDADSTKRKDDYEKILTAFANEEADILVGTQMIVKGHDFPNVTLVGVLAADISLNAEDYTASERTFQLLTQAAGRAGRGDSPGEVIIQTYHPEHFAIQTAQMQNYDRFYQEEIAYRKLLHYPPCGHMLVILMQADKESNMEYLANDMTQALEPFKKDVIILGPVDARIRKISDVYYKVIYVKAPKDEQLVHIKNTIEQHRKTTQYRYGQVQFDFDPINSY